MKRLETFCAHGVESARQLDLVGGQIIASQTTGRLAQVLDGGGATLATYSYGASNQRLMSVEGGVTTYYGWDGGQIIAEYAPSGANELLFQTGYVYLGNRLLATVSAVPGSGTRFHHPDRLGTNVVTDQSNGELVTKQMGMPFGTQQPMGAFGGDNSWQHSTKNNPSKKRFTSYDRSDATGLDYAVNRHYSSAQCRFTQVDPIGMEAVSLEDPQTLNLYSYCANDPINYVDPDGLFFGKLFRWIGKIFKVVAIAVFVAGAILLTAWLAVAAIAGSWAAGAPFFSAFSALMSGVGAFLGGAPTSMIINFFGASASASAAAGIAINWTLAGVGAVSSFTAQRGRQRRGRRGRGRRESPELPAEVIERARGVLEVIARNNQARDAGADDATVLCQSYKESRHFPDRATRSGTYRGLLQVGPTAAEEVGVSREEFNRVAFDPAQNVHIGTSYLALRIRRARGNLQRGLEGYGTGRGYATNILRCAELVRVGNLEGGLRAIGR